MFTLENTKERRILLKNRGSTIELPLVHGVGTMH